MNDINALVNAFSEAEKKDYFFEAVIMEPVMGEGNPGLAMSKEFYSKVRELTL